MQEFRLEEPEFNTEIGPKIQEYFARILSDIKEKLIELDIPLNLVENTCKKILEWAIKIERMHIALKKHPSLKEFYFVGTSFKNRNRSLEINFPSGQAFMLAILNDNIQKTFKPKWPAHWHSKLELAKQNLKELENAAEETFNHNLEVFAAILRRQPVPVIKPDSDSGIWVETTERLE